MESLQGILQLSASDLVGHLNCRYLTSLNRAVAQGALEAPNEWDPLLQILRDRGAAHERSYLEHLETAGMAVVSIAGAGIGGTLIDQTIAAMRDGADIIAQGVNSRAIVTP